jgi:hypothetical protein
MFVSKTCSHPTLCLSLSDSLFLSLPLSLSHIPGVVFSVPISWLSPYVVPYSINQTKPNQTKPTSQCTYHDCLSLYAPLYLYMECTFTYMQPQHCHVHLLPCHSTDCRYDERWSESQNMGHTQLTMTLHPIPTTSSSQQCQHQGELRQTHNSRMKIAQVSHPLTSHMMSCSPHDYNLLRHALQYSIYSPNSLTPMSSIALQSLADWSMSHTQTIDNQRLTHFIGPQLYVPSARKWDVSECQ